MRAEDASAPETQLWSVPVGGACAMSNIARRRISVNGQNLALRQSTGVRTRGLIPAARPDSRRSAGPRRRRRRRLPWAEVSGRCCRRPRPALRRQTHEWARCPAPAGPGCSRRHSSGDPTAWRGTRAPGKGPLRPWLASAAQSFPVRGPSDYPSSQWRRRRCRGRHRLGASGRSWRAPALRRSRWRSHDQ